MTTIRLDVTPEEIATVAHAAQLADPTTRRVLTALVARARKELDRQLGMKINPAPWDNDPEYELRKLRD